MLVLPLLVVHALPVFAIAATLAFVGGEVVPRQTLSYGRRIFVVFLLLGVAGTFLASSVLGVAGSAGLVMAVLPGLFAFNLHREGRPLHGALLFLAWLSLFVLLGAAALLLASIETEGLKVLGPPLLAGVLLLPAPRLGPRRSRLLSSPGPRVAPARGLGMGLEEQCFVRAPACTQV